MRSTETPSPIAETAQAESRPELRLRVLRGIAEIDAESWNACANPQPPAEAADAGSQLAQASSQSAHEAHELYAKPQEITSRYEYNPFISYDFLEALEASHSVGDRTGWLVQHVAAETADGRLVGAVPCYLKSHSRGEYVFDWGWAEAYERAGGAYYPKLQVSVPFTPAAGRRLLVRPSSHEGLIRDGLIAALRELCERRRASSVHLTFLTEPEWHVLAEHGFLQRTDQQFHWENAGYATFDDFLAALASRKRKAIKRERREAVEAGISVHWITGADLTEAVWDAFFRFYMDTGSRKWGRPYLTRAFFSLVGERMRERILLVMAKRNGRFVAGALNFIGSHALYGRHWGAIEHHPFLHFELCYYQAIEFAIARRLPRVEAGAQGEHKLARGYVPITTFSAHYIVDPGLRRAIADYLVRERAYVEAAGRELGEMTPFRKDLEVDA